MSALPVYLAGPDLIEAGGVEGLELSEGAPAPIPVRDLAGFPGPEHVPGWILVSTGVGGEELLGFLLRIAKSQGTWSPLLVNGDRVIPLCPGWPEPPAKIGHRLSEGGSSARFLSFRQAMEDLARVRHDINNPLTAAFAEVQLALLDEEPGTERAAGLEVVEDQIRRIRDLVAGLTGYRIPRP